MHHLRRLSPIEPATLPSVSSRETTSASTEAFPEVSNNLPQLSVKFIAEGCSGDGSIESSNRFDSAYKQFVRRTEDYGHRITFKRF